MDNDKYWQEHTKRMKTLLEKVGEILQKAESQEAVLDYECGSEHYTLIILKGDPESIKNRIS